MTIDSYTTTFPLTENPISENGNWLNGKTNGIDWNDCQTMGGDPGLASGAQPGTGQSHESICVRTGTFSAAQSAAVTVHVAHSIGAQYDEVEAHVNTTIIAGKITGYEGYCPDHRQLGGPDAEISLRWNGPLANATNSNNGFICAQRPQAGVTCTTGDVVKLSNDGTGNPHAQQKRDCWRSPLKTRHIWAARRAWAFTFRTWILGATAASGCRSLWRFGLHRYWTVNERRLGRRWDDACSHGYGELDSGCARHRSRGELQHLSRQREDRVDCRHKLYRFECDGRGYVHLLRHQHRCFGHRKRAFEFSYCDDSRGDAAEAECTNRRYSYQQFRGVASLAFTRHEKGCGGYRLMSSFDNKKALRGCSACGYTPTTAITSVTVTITAGDFAAGTKFMILVQD